MAKVGRFYIVTAQLGEIKRTPQATVRQAIEFCEHFKVTNALIVELDAPPIDGTAIRVSDVRAQQKDGVWEIFE